MEARSPQHVSAQVPCRPQIRANLGLIKPKRLQYLVNPFSLGLFAPSPPPKSHLPWPRRIGTLCSTVYKFLFLKLA